jgi:hypothetical protein
LGYTMLTYPPGTSTMGLADAALPGGIAGKGLKKQIEKAQQAKGDFLGLVVGNILPEFVAVDGFELCDRLAAQLSWRFHTSQITRVSVMQKDGRFAADGTFPASGNSVVRPGSKISPSGHFPAGDFRVSIYRATTDLPGPLFFVKKLPFSAKFLSYRRAFYSFSLES